MGFALCSVVPPGKRWIPMHEFYYGNENVVDAGVMPDFGHGAKFVVHLVGIPPFELLWLDNSQ